MGNSTLLIGSYHTRGIQCADWFGDLPNLSDYDVLILDTTKITEWCKKTARYDGRNKYGSNKYVIDKPTTLEGKLQANIARVKQKLLEVLEFPVCIYALYLPDLDIWTEQDTFNPMFGKGKAPQSFFLTNDWCPISLDTVQENGRVINVVDPSYAKYFETFKGYDFYFATTSLDIAELQSFYRNKGKVTSSLLPIATNKVDKPIAVDFHPRFHRWDREGKGWQAQYYQTGGDLLLLPVADVYHTELYIESILMRNRDSKETPPPAWVDNISIPGEGSLQAEISKQQGILNENKAKMVYLQDKLGDIQRYKGLLYETGLNLQDICKSVFEQFGATTKPSVVTDEFIVEIHGKDALIEVKGNTKSISKSDVAQLITDLGEHLKKTGEDIHGILVGNAWRLLPLEERGSKERPIFPEDVTRIAVNRGIGLISTDELFKAYCRIIEEPGCKDDVLKKIINGKGVVSFIPQPP